MIYDLGAPSSGAELFLSHNWPEHIDSIIDSSLDILQNILGAAPQYDGAQFAIIGVPFEDDQFFWGDLLNPDVIRFSDFLRRGGFEFGQNCGSDCSSHSS